MGLDAACRRERNSGSPAKRRAAEQRGRDAESDIASLWRAKGYDILAQRLRTGSGELDLVVANAGCLVFIEVKARKSLTEAAYSISARQQARLLEAASLALAAHAEWQRDIIRFDVALVQGGGAVEHIEDAIRYQ